jgi:hypothetical protein
MVRAEMEYYPEGALHLVPEPFLLLLLLVVEIIYALNLPLGI